MARCYSVPVKNRQPSLPLLWLVSDVRNDAVLETVLARLPRGSGLVFRHYHLPPAERRARLARLLRIARRRGHVVAVSGDMALARRLGADGAYGPAGVLAKGMAGLRLATAHDLRELAAGARARADAVLLSPVFPTASHPGGKAIGPMRWRLIAARSPVPVIALGGVTAQRARSYRLARWAAIDGLSAPLGSSGMRR
jgi:thiamine-phosphate pyrophosphorylase